MLHSTFIHAASLIASSTLFLTLLRFGAVLSIICGLLMAVLYLDPFTAMYCRHAVVSEDVKTTLPWIKFTLEYPFNISTSVGRINTKLGTITAIALLTIAD